MNGILVVDKAEGPTSRRVVDLVRRSLKVRKAGHLGTLDPFATGVLPVLLGKSTRLARFLSGGKKTYEGVIRLGATSDTLDRTGEILQQREVPPGLDLATITPFIEKLSGEIDQVPPMYSAIQVDGQRLYSLARKGIEVERKPRQVTIDRFEITSIALPMAGFQVRCGPGTYIRSLVHDLGEALGCGALLEELRRSAAEPFGLDQAVPQAELEADEPGAWIRDRVIPLEALDLGLPRLTLDQQSSELVAHGGAVALPDNSKLPPGLPDQEQHLCLHRPDGTLAAVGRLEPGPRILIQPVVVLAPNSE
jgi:tRNA pseudouridine55 synthase